MREVKHCLPSKVKHYLLPDLILGAENQAVLDRLELARRIRAAMEGAKPPVTSAAVAKRCNVTPQAVSGWLKTGRVSKGRIEVIAELTGKPLAYFLSKNISAACTIAEPRELGVKEEILLELFAGLFRAQQRELIREMRALFDANQVTRKELGQRALRGVDDERIEAAFGAVPPIDPQRKRGPSGNRSDRGRHSDNAMDDFPEG